MQDPQHRIEPIYTTKEVAERLGVTPEAIRAAIRRGDLRASYPFNRTIGYRVTETWLMEWLERHATPVSDGESLAEAQVPRDTPADA